MNKELKEGIVKLRLYLGVKTDEENFDADKYIQEMVKAKLLHIDIGD